MPDCGAGTDGRWGALRAGILGETGVLRVEVGAENGSGTAAPGLLGLGTNCASRINALSGRASNEGITAVAVGAGAVMRVEAGDCFALRVCETLIAFV